MDEGRQGKIVTFYSYKGGTGRTMALANVAWILAANGKRVLVADWDLESPGLHRFFHPFLDTAAVSASAGIIDMIRAFEFAATHPEEDRRLDWHGGFARVLDYAISLNWDFPDDGTLDFLSAGMANRAYSAAVTSLDWDNFYEHLGGGQFFDALRENMKTEYDYTLIDSRTGLTDVADICTVHLPDALVTCFTLSDQGIEGAASVAREIKLRYSDRGIRIFPLPTRVDDGEKQRADTGRAVARHKFDGLPAGMTSQERTAYWGAVEVPYRPFYAYEETLATFGDEPGAPGGLLARFECLASYLTDGEVTALPEMQDSERHRVLDLFMRRAPKRRSEVAVTYVPEDRAWAEWVGAALEAAGMAVNLISPREVAAHTNAGEVDGMRVLAVVSPTFLRSQPVLELARRAAQRDPMGRLDLLQVVEVADTRLPSFFTRRKVARLAGLLSEESALQALSRLVDPVVAAVLQQAGPRLPRFPGRVPAIWNAPPRNANFTGRDLDLDDLRDKLSASSVAVVLPVALHGLGGVGKTQVTLEYVHRFKVDYDLVWWINAEKPESVSTGLTQLAEQMGIRVGGSSTDTVKDVLAALRQGEPTARWLIVFDNAEEPAQLNPFIPEGSGHVLITTRIQAWSHRATPLEVDVFDRAESIEHLCRRVPSLAEDEADSVAHQLGDLPLAVEAAASWLAETGMQVETYLHQLREETTKALSRNRAVDYPLPVEAVWNISLERLESRSPAAVRLLHICAFMAPEISLKLVNGKQMAEELKRYDESLADPDPMLLGRVIQEIVRLGLAKTDTSRQLMYIHRLVQGVIRSQASVAQSEELGHVVHLVLAAARPETGDTDDPANWPLFEMIWPHLEPSRARRCTQERIRQLYTDHVRYLRQIGDYSTALEIGEPVARQWTRELERATEDGIDAAHSAVLRRNLLHMRFQVANNYRALGRYAEALALDGEVRDQQTSLLGADHPHTLMTAGSLAADLRAVGRFSEALKIDIDTRTKLDEMLSEDHPRSLMAANNLAVSYRLAGDCFMAREIDEWVLARRRVVLGSKHPYTLISAASVGRDLREVGEYQQSIEVLTHARDDLEAVLGPESPTTISTLSSLAVSLRKAGFVGKALELAQLAYDRAGESARGEDTITRNACALNLATCASAAGDHRRATELIRPTQAWYDEHLGEYHPYALLCHISMAIAKRGLTDRKAALAEAELAYAALTASLGPRHRFTLVAAVTLANCHGDLGNARKAEELERESVPALSDLLGSNHPDTLACESNLAVSLGAQGLKQEAGMIRERMVALLELHLGAEHRNTIRARTSQRINLSLEASPI